MIAYCIMHMCMYTQSCIIIIHVYTKILQQIHAVRWFSIVNIIHLCTCIYMWMVAGYYEWEDITQVNKSLFPKPYIYVHVGIRVGETSLLLIPTCNEY